MTSEMFGFAGRGLLILLYALVLWRGLRTMARASSQMDMLVAGADRRHARLPGLR